MSIITILREYAPPRVDADRHTPDKPTRVRDDDVERLNECIRRANEEAARK